MNPRRPGIHNYKEKIKQEINLINQSKLSKSDKNLILKYDVQLQLDGISIARRLRILGALKVFCLDYLKKDLAKATKEDLKGAILSVEDNEDYSPWTVSSYKGIVKKLYKFIEYGDDYRTVNEYPERVRWINTNIKAKDRPRINASDILTEEEVLKLIEVATSIRDKCFVAMLYELGARISEIGNLKIKDITKDHYGYLIDLYGKTGHRTPRVILADPYITAWLNEHPLKHNPNAPLWVVIGDRNNLNKPMNYRGLCKIIKTLARRAEIKKRVYPHLFRHSRVTHLLSTGKINESQAKVYFGWTPDSKMLSEYSHLVSRDVNDAILALHGIVKDEGGETALKSKVCFRCKTINKPDAIFCYRCGATIDVKTSFELEEVDKYADYIYNENEKRGHEEIEKTVRRVVKEILRQQRGTTMRGQF